MRTRYAHIANKSSRVTFARLSTTPFYLGAILLAARQRCRAHI